MQVEALANSLHVSFLAPRIENEHETWTMKNIYNPWLYHMQYWKNGSDTKVSWQAVGMADVGSLLLALCGCEAMRTEGGC